MPELSLRVMAQVVQGQLTGNPEQVIRNLETDSRKVRTGADSLFIAIRGERHDGHHYIAQLLEQGISSFILEKLPDNLVLREQCNYILVNHSMLALQKLGSYYRSTLSMPLVAITGSNGKTVVKEWLSQCLALGGTVSRSPKSYNSQLGVPLSLWMIDPKSDWAVIEAGISEPGEMEKLQAMIQPRLGIFTMLGPAHQENFESLEQKCREKLRLFRQVETLYYCYDHELIREQLLREKTIPHCVCWSLRNPQSDLYISKLHTGLGSTLVDALFQQHPVTLQIPFTDRASVENCLHIFLFLLHQGFDLVTIQQGISSLSPVAMRLEQVAGIQNSTLINDSYNSDIHSLRIALDYMSVQQQHKKRTVVLSDILQSGQEASVLYRQVGDLLQRYTIDQLVLVGEQITKSADMPRVALRFESTSALLQQLGALHLRNHVVLIKGARAFGFEKVVGSLSEKKHTTVLEIDLNKLLGNLNYFRGLLKPPTRIMVMVKALSYGSGGHEIANLLQHHQVDYLGVAFTDEGIALREAGINLPIMVMSPAMDSFDEIMEYRLEPEIYSLEGLQQLSDLAVRSQETAYPVHIKLDTGMHRLGFMPEELQGLLEALGQVKNIRVKAVFSHLAVSSDPREDDFTRHQLQIFLEMYEKISGVLGYRPLRHILNSAGIERFPEAHLEMVRLGIGLHGISGAGAGLETVSTLKTRIVQIKHLSKTETVGYNRHGILSRDSVIAVVPVGYADGLNRRLGNRTGSVLVNGQYCQYVGDICMDMSMIDITEVKASVNDEVIIFGHGNPVEDMAARLGTIPYEILTSVSGRVKRVYINE